MSGEIELFTRRPVVPRSEPMLRRQAAPAAGTRSCAASDAREVRADPAPPAGGRIVEPGLRDFTTAGRVPVRSRRSDVGLYQAVQLLATGFPGSSGRALDLQA